MQNKCCSEHCILGCRWPDNEDGEAIEMAFSKKKVEDRKRWLSAFRAGTYLDQSVDNIRYKDFVHKVSGDGDFSTPLGDRLVKYVIAQSSPWAPKCKVVEHAGVLHLHCKAVSVSLPAVGADPLQSSRS